MYNKTCRNCKHADCDFQDEPCFSCLDETNREPKFGEPSPVPNSSRPVWEVVIEDMFNRNEFGKAKYGTPLQANNGRNALKDAYEEVLDLAVYLKQRIIEDEQK